MAYQVADSSWLAACRAGVSVHWTAQSVPVSGAAQDFQRAVEEFPAESFLENVARSGATYFIFTATHALQKLPAPCAALDEIAENRTCARDLIGDLARACRGRGLHFLLYYNHSCNGADDPQWERAVGYHGADKDAFAENIFSIVAELGARYGDLVEAFWFDSSYSLDGGGPVNSVTTDLGNWRFPWERFSQVAKTGHAARLVTFNAGVTPQHRAHLYSTHQDYLAGEVNDMLWPPQARLGVGGLQEHRWVCLDNPTWVHAAPETPLLAPRYSDAEIASYVGHANELGVPVTFNVDVAQNGAISEASLAALHRAGAMTANVASTRDASS